MKVIVIDPGYLRSVAMRGTGRTTRMILRAILAAEHQDVVVVLRYHQQIPAAAMTICRIFPQSVYRTHNRTVTIANHTIQFITPSDSSFDEQTKRVYGWDQPVFLDHAITEN